MKAHHAIDKLIVSAKLNSFQDGGIVPDERENGRDVETLLSILSKGKYKTSRDLPEIREQTIPILELLTGAMHVPEGEQTNMFNLALALPLAGGGLRATGGARSALDKILSKYGKKAHTQIRGLIDYNRAIALDIPEKAMPMERAINRMIRIIEPDAKKRRIIEDAYDAEEWTEFTGPLTKMVTGHLKKKPPTGN